MSLVTDILTTECSNGRMRSPAPHTTEARGALRDWARESERLLECSSMAMPEPVAVLHSLPRCAIMALRTAQQTNNGWRLRHSVRNMEAGDILFSAGLVEARGPHLGNFGAKVRKLAAALSESELG